jgi:LPS sulfotransferase NodH
LGRNGSTLLTELLNAHESIHCDGEILFHRVAAPRLQVAGHAMASPKPVYGFKLLTYQLEEVQHVDPPSFFRWLDRRGYRIIHVRRRDILRHALSNLNARVHGFHHHGSLPPEARGAIHVDTESLIDWLDGIARNGARNEALLADLPHETVHYEDDLSDAASQARTVTRICAVLGVPTQLVSTDLVRVTPARIEDLVANYDEVAAFLAGTPYERFLHAGS